MNNIREALDAALARVVALRICDAGDRERLLDELQDAIALARRMVIGENPQENESSTGPA